MGKGLALPSPWHLPEPEESAPEEMPGVQFPALEGVCSSFSCCLVDVDNCAILECVSAQQTGVLVLRIEVIGHSWLFL